MNEDKINSHGAAALTDGFKGTIYMASWNIGTLIHEYRHYLGLSPKAGKPDFLYHGDDPCDAGFDRTNHPEYCSNISRVAGFARGIDSDEMEIYMHHGENAVDDHYIPEDNNLLGFFLLKALGLNDITIVY